MSRPGVLVLSVMALLTASCGGGHRPAGGSATTESPTTASTAPATTTTTAVAVLGGTSPNDAAGHLLAAWKAGDRQAARTEADSAAVDAVFAQPYPAGGLQARGCDDNPSQSSCVYRVGDALLNIHTVRTPVGWRVDSAQFEQ